MNVHLTVNSGPQNQADGAALAPTNSISGVQDEQGPGGIGEQAGLDKELQVREVPGNIVEVAADNVGSSLASCDAGEVVTGRRFDTEGTVNEHNLTVHSSKDPGSEAWSLQIVNPGPDSVIIQAHAECEKLVDAS